MFLLLQGQPSACDLNLLSSLVLWDGSQTNPLPQLFFTLASPTHFPTPRHTWKIPRLSPPGTICPSVLLAANTSQEQPGPTHRLPRFPLSLHPWHSGFCPSMSCTFQGPSDTLVTVLFQRSPPSWLCGAQHEPAPPSPPLLTPWPSYIPLLLDLHPHSSFPASSLPQP